MSVLPRLKAGLRHHKLDNQMLVYDSAGDTVHLLDPTTGSVVEILEEGGWTPQGVLHEVKSRTGVQDADAAFSLALDELGKAGLLTADEGKPEPLVDIRRREMLRRLAIGGAATFLVPAIATLTATKASAATLLANCAPCTTGTQCASGNCGKDNQCYTPNAPGCLGMDAPCTLATSCQCCKGDCTGTTGEGGCA